MNIPPLLALKRALRAAIGGDAEIAAQTHGQPLYDHPPPAARFPYLSFGQGTVHDWSTATEPGSEILLTLDIWSRARGSAEISTLAESALAAAAGADPSADGHALIHLHSLGWIHAFDAASDVHHAALTLRAVLEPL